MINYIIFLSIVILIVIIANITKGKGFKNLKVIRELESDGVVEGEDFKISIIVENRKKFPISFMLIKEVLPEDLIEGRNLNVTKYMVQGYERVKKTYLLSTEKRGTYLLRNMDITIGDIFGFFTSSEQMEDYKELVVYPKIKKMKDLKFENRGLQGDSIVKRWIHKDPLYIKGIRQYSIEDRMKDIHWKSSLKMNKLMVKEYDYTSNRQFVIIMNVQCGEFYGNNINVKAVDEGIKVMVSLTNEVINEGVNVGLWTNANMISYYKNTINEMKSSTSMKNVLEFCARMDYYARKSFDEYLKSRIKYFNKNNIYVIVTPFLNDNSVNLILKLRNRGFNIKIIDVSPNLDVPHIRGVEKMSYRGEMNS
ncbi:DUF58 domain-containing protein [Haloimpatiens sp. FM7330]|uniref:DUF58 domain-containing protein n=1 Tax=Haloimpatiens sp. FM7330 TaxID=3298610 RepID=UPI00362D5C0B